jgi:hypothetical protein
MEEDLTPAVIPIEEADRRDHGPLVGIEVRGNEADQFEHEVLPALIDYRNRVAENPEGHDVLIDHIAPTVLDSVPGTLELRTDRWETLNVLMSVPGVRKEVGRNRLDYLRNKINRRVMLTLHERNYGE